MAAICPECGSVRVSERHIGRTTGERLALSAVRERGLQLVLLCRSWGL